MTRRDVGAVALVVTFFLGLSSGCSAKAFAQAAETTNLAPVLAVSSGRAQARCWRFLDDATFSLRADGRDLVTCMNGLLAEALQRQQNKELEGVFLVRAYRVYLVFRQVSLGLEDQQPQNSNEKTTQVDLQTARGALAILATAMADAGLLSPFSAALVTGAIFADPEGNGASGMMSSGTKPLAHVLWKSRSFRPDSSVGFSFGGRFGIQPALALVGPVSGLSGPTPAPTEGRSESSGDEMSTTYQQAFVWDIGAELHVLRLPRRLPNGGHLAGFARLGQVRLTSDLSLVDRGPNSFVAIPLNGKSSAEFFFETGVKFELFNNPLGIVYDDNGLTPLFSIEAAFRRDNRFKKEGELVDFDSPESRFVFRFLIDALTVVDKRAEAEPDKTFTVGFGVEYERALKGETTLPSGTKFLISADVNLLQAIGAR